jgi:lysozyme
MAAGKTKRRSKFLPILFLLLVAGAAGGFLWIYYRYPVRGIDVSHHQSKIDWPTVGQQGLSFAFIKATEGATLVDEDFEDNWKGAKEAGLVRGAYHYFLPQVDAKKQAENFLKEVNLRPGDLPPVLDLEETGGKSPEVIAKGAKQWMEIVEERTGVRPILYTFPAFVRDELPENRLREYPLWIAHLRITGPTVPIGFKKWIFWQYTHSAKIKGIEGPVDKDYFHGSMEDLKGLCID